MCIPCTEMRCVPEQTGCVDRDESSRDDSRVESGATGTVEGRVFDVIESPE